MKAKNGTMAILFFIVSAIAIALYTFGYLPESTALVVIGLFGFSGFGAVRAWLNGKGWKTWGSVILGVIGIVLEAFGVITPDQLAKWLAFWGTIAGVGIGHAVHKMGK